MLIQDDRSQLLKAAAMTHRSANDAVLAVTVGGLQ